MNPASKLCMGGALFLFLTVPAVSMQDPDSLVRVAWRIQDQRLDPRGELAGLLQHGSAQVRQAAFRALAHSRDTSLFRSVANGLKDRDPGVRAMAAFAAGQLSMTGVAPQLLALSVLESETTARAGILDALGRTGTLAELDSLAEMFPISKRRDRGAILNAMARFSLRGVRSPRSLWYAMGCLADQDPDVRWRSLYLLWRSAPHPLLATELSARAGLFAKLARDPSADVRLNLATLLGRIESEEARTLLTELAGVERRSLEEDWRVRVQIVRSAGAHARRDGSMVPLLMEGLADTNDHVVIAACMALPGDAAGLGSSDLRDSIRIVLRALTRSTRTRPPLVAGEAAVALIRLAPEDADMVLSLGSNTETPHRIRAKYMEALSYAPTPSVWSAFRAAWDAPELTVAMASWDHVRRLFRESSLKAFAQGVADRRKVGNEAFEGIVRALQRNDMGLSTVVSSLLTDSNTVALMDSGGHRADLVEVLVGSLKRMKIPDDVEAMQSAVQALGYLGGPAAISALEGILESPDRTVVEEALKALEKASSGDRRSSVRPAGPPVHIDYDWQLLRSLGSKPTADIVTDRGTVTVVLRPDIAPFTVVSFVRLARAGYFDGLTFHRVVPNFVVQGGDPRGDGWGGPGYAIRTESSPMSFERGSVGMASAGNDTEGSQFFITHVPTPHLDGRYTLFATVVRGMDVVDRLQVGDSILQVKIRDQRGARSR